MTAEALRDDILDFAGRHTGIAAPVPAATTTPSSAATREFRWPSFMPPAPRPVTASTSSRKAYLSPRTIAFNVQGVRLAVHTSPARSASCTACMPPTSAG